MKPIKEMNAGERNAESDRIVAGSGRDQVRAAEDLGYALGFAEGWNDATEYAIGRPLPQRPLPSRRSAV